MAVVFCESFDRVATIAQMVGADRGTIDASKRWDGHVSNSSFMSLVSGRTGNCLRIITPSASNSYIEAYQWVPDATTMYMGCAVRPGSVAAGVESLFGFMATTVAIGTDVQRTGSALRVTGVSTPYFTTPSLLVANVWSYIELKVIWADAGGVIELRHNRVLVGTFTGDTKVGATTSIQGIFVGNRSANQTTTKDFDDLYVTNTTDASGVGNTGYLGDVVVPCLRPNGDGTYSQWVGSDADSVNNYQLVDEQSVNDADYVESTVDGDKDTYAFEDATDPGGHVIKAVVLGTRIASLTGGNKNVRYIKKNADGEDDSAINAATTTMSDRQVVMEKSPADAAWASFAELNSTEFGPKQSA